MDDDLGWSDLERAWVAALLDGEGWIGLVRVRAEHRFRVGVVVNQTNPGQINYLQQLLGGRGGVSLVTGRPGNRKDCHSIRLNDRELIRSVLLAVRDLLVVKQARADIVLEFLRHYGSCAARYADKMACRLYRQCLGREHEPSGYAAEVIRALPTPALDAWLAALVDGEGTITINFVRGARSRGSHVPRIEIGSTCESLVRLIREVAGIGSVQHEHRGSGRTAGERDLWRWVVGTRGTAAVLSRIVPYLKIKQDQAEVARQLLALPVARGRQRIPDWVWDRREALRATLRDLNCKGKYPARVG